MDLFEARRQVLLRLIDGPRFGGVQAKFCRETGVPASYVTRMLKEPGEKARKPIGEDMALKIEEKLNLETGEMLNPVTHRRAGHLRAVGSASPDDQSSAVDLPAPTVSVPLLATTASMGPGDDRGSDDIVIGQMTLSKSWIGKTIKPITRQENLRFIHGHGNSMEPTFSDGDVLLVDGGVNQVDVDGVYVLEAHERLFIKSVRQRFSDGVFEISSDNPNVKTVDVLDGSHPVAVLGRVVWIWNGKKV